MNFIFSDKAISEYVEGEKKELPFADALAELDKVFSESADKPQNEKADKDSEADTNASTVSDSRNNSDNVLENTT